MTQEISGKNTKKEILEAYDELLEKVQNAKENMPKKVQEEKQRKEIVEKVADVSNKNITQGINNLKISLNNSLEELENNLITEFKKLEEIRSAITIEKQNLDDLYSLSTTTDSLAAMLLVQKEKKESFDAEINVEKEDFKQEMINLREQWKLEKEKQNIEQKENTELLKKNRLREEEEYKYNLKIARKKDTDEYETAKAKLEKELSEKKESFNLEMVKREADVANTEAELKELRKNNDEFPKQLQKTLADKEKEITERLTVQFDFESKLLAKQNEGELNLKEQTIVSLKEKITEMQMQTKELTAKANLADSNVKDIAVKAIESSSKIQVFPSKEKKEED